MHKRIEHPLHLRLLCQAVFDLEEDLLKRMCLRFFDRSLANFASCR